MTTERDKALASIRFGLGDYALTCQPVLTYNVAKGQWQVWHAHDHAFENGTFTELQNDGTMVRVTKFPDGTEEVFVIPRNGRQT